MIPRGSLAFLEEPIRCESPEAYASLRAMTDVPMAIGEEFPSKWAFLPYIDLMPHNPIGPVCTAATVHLAAACNNVACLEVIPQISESAADVFPVMIERDPA